MNRPLQQPSSGQYRDAVTSETNLPADCAGCPARRNGLCAGFSSTDLVNLEPLRKVLSYQRGDIIARAGERPDFLASVVSGSAILTQVMEDGRTQIVSLLLPPDVLGRPGGKHISYDVVASTDLSLCLFRRHGFSKAVSKVRTFENNFLKKSLDNLDTTRQWMLSLGRKTSRERLATFMVMLASREISVSGSDPDCEITFLLPLTRVQIAQFLGLAYETACRTMSELERSEVIEFRGAKQAITVPDLRRLLNEAGDDDGVSLI